ncbi:MAG: peptidylprolyl isomerase, partial [Planktomarina sp.]
MTRPTNLIHTLLTVLTVVGVSLFGQTAQAQKKYEVVITVNDAAITRYEIDQRLKFNAVIGQRGARRAKVEDTLIDDRLRLQAA